MSDRTKTRRDVYARLDVGKGIPTRLLGATNAYERPAGTWTGWVWS
jgi:hypothetical protein